MALNGANRRNLRDTAVNAIRLRILDPIGRRSKPTLSETCFTFARKMPLGQQHMCHSRENEFAISSLCSCLTKQSYVLSPNPFRDELSTDGYDFILLSGTSLEMLTLRRVICVQTDRQENPPSYFIICRLFYFLII